MIKTLNEMFYKGRNKQTTAHLDMQMLLSDSQRTGVWIYN